MFSLQIKKCINIYLDVYTEITKNLFLKNLKYIYNFYFAKVRHVKTKRYEYI